MMDGPIATTAPALELRAMSVRSRQHPGCAGIRNINWKVAPGDFWVVGGMIGADRSDLLMLAGGLLAPECGEQFFFGGPMPLFEEANLAQRLRLGFVFQGGQLLNQLTLAENIALPLRYHKDVSAAEAEADVRWLLELTGLSRWADRSPGEVSVDSCQRAGLARALILKPDVLFMDNPLAGLDAPQRHWWRQFLAGLADGPEWRQGRPMTLLATGEDLRLWRGCARQFAILKESSFVPLGTWAEAQFAAVEFLSEPVFGLGGQEGSC